MVFGLECLVVRCVWCRIDLRVVVKDGEHEAVNVDIFCHFFDSRQEMGAHAQTLCLSRHLNLVHVDNGSTILDAEPDHPT